MTTGYSGTPLAKKLGIKEGFIIRLFHEPEDYFRLVADMPHNVQISTDPAVSKDLIHFFTKSRAELQQHILILRKELKSNGMIWISWPKKASKVPTDITEDSIRSLALSNGLVDVKVCAVDETWSGLKLVIPVKDRVR
jgi:hypothetical protein